MAETIETDSLPCPNHQIHQSRFSELALGTGSNQQSYLRALIFFNKKPGLTDEFFHEHWKSVHADLTMQVENAGVNLVRYSQFHQEQQHKDAFQPMIDASGGAMQFASYDGCAEFHAESIDKFIAFLQGVWASSHLVGCGQRFADLGKGYHVMVGYDNLILGPAIPGMGDKDGISTGDERLNTSKRVGVEKASSGVDETEKTDSGTEEGPVASTGSVDVE